MLSRNELRERAMTVLYQMDIYSQNNISCDAEVLLKETLGLESVFAKNLVLGTLEKKEELDLLANKYLKDWDINRLDKTGSAILRMALYEMKYTITPPIVVINEAVELAKKYTDEELVKMINAVLDHFMKEELSYEP